MGVASNAAEWVSAAAAVATSLILLATLAYAIQQVREARQLREQQLRPWVVVDFHFRSVLMSIRIKNIGASAARDVALAMDPPWASTLPDAEVPAVFRGARLPQLAPNEERVYEFDAANRRLSSDLPRQHVVTVNYKAHDGADLPSDVFVLDLDPIEGALIPDRGVHELAGEVERLRKVVEKLARRQA